MTPVIGFSAPSGTGKTTLLEAVIAHLAGLGLRIGAIKHGHHPADPDTPGKDTHRFRQAGAETVLFACQERWFLIQDLQNRPEPTLAQQVRQLGDHDLILVEGYKNDSHPKIVIHRQGVSASDFFKKLENVVAVATDDPKMACPAPLLPLEDAGAVAHFILRYLGLTPREVNAPEITASDDKKQS